MRDHSPFLLPADFGFAPGASPGRESKRGKEVKEMKNVRVLLGALLLAGLVKVAFSQEAGEKKAPVAVEMKETVHAAMANMTNAVDAVTEKVNEVTQNAAK